MDGEFKDTGMTPQELWREAMPHFVKCLACGAPHTECVIRIVVLADPAEYERRFPQAAAALRARNYAENGIDALPIADTAFGLRMVKITDAGACATHRKEAEIAAARGPDWCYTHIDYGPVGGPEKPRVVVQVPLGFEKTDAERASDKRLVQVKRQPKEPKIILAGD